VFEDSWGQGAAVSHTAFRSALSAIVLGILLGLPRMAEPATPPNGEDPTRYSLQSEILRMVQSTGWRSAEWGILAVSLETGDTLVALDPDRPLAPASNQKLFTTAVALHHLGPDFRFPTYLLTDGSLRDGVLEGNLILYGTGDPAISDRLLGSTTEVFRDFARQLLAEGIHTVSGDVVGDGTYFHGPTRRPSWNPRDLDSWFAAPVSALTFNENVVTLRVRSGAPGTRPSVVTMPAGAELPLVNTSLSVGGSPRTPLMLVRRDPDGQIELSGEMRTGAAEVWRVLTVSDPAAYAASVFRHVLEEEGVRVVGGARSHPMDATSAVTRSNVIAPAFQRDDPPPLRTLAVHYSPPVAELVHVVNKRSHNLYAELLLFAVGRIVGEDGSFAGGSRVLTDYLVRVVGVPESELHVEDGSGLSRLNQATPSSFVRLLTHVSGTPMADAFWASLPAAGNRQELGRMYQSPAAGNLRAKTGTINQVSALSGVVRTAGGEPILFSIVSNQVPSSGVAKRIEDQIGIRIASERMPTMAGMAPMARVEYGDHGPRILAVDVPSPGATGLEIVRDAEGEAFH